MKGKSKKEAGDLSRDNTRDRDRFIVDIVKTLPVKRVDQKVSNINQPTEPTLVHIKSGKRICWLSPRAGCLFGAYCFGENDKEIRKIHNDAEIDELKAWLTLRCDELDKSPTKKPKTSKAKRNHTETVKQLKDRIEKMDKKANALNVKTLTEEIEKYCQGEGYTIIPNEVSGFDIVVREIND